MSIQALEGMGNVLVFETKRRNKNKDVIRGLRKIEDVIRDFFGYSKPNERSWVRDKNCVNHLEFFKGKYLHEITPLGIKQYKKLRYPVKI